MDLEEGQVEVRSEMRGFEELSFILEESNAGELTEAGLAAMEADLDAVEVSH